ncbi:hypothetical protein FACS1894193_07920 [Bacilli bacterium]|nr:hypothetical protein FACS1894193_07920 [Bacilli bacterium]
MKLVSVLNELPIVGIQEGKVIGITSKVVVSMETRCVKYLIFNMIQHTNVPTAIDFEAVRGLGNDYIVVLTANEIKPFSDKSIHLERTVDLIGTPVLMDLGNKVGKVIDFEINEKTGEISKIILDSDNSFTGQQIISLSEHFIIVTEIPECYQITGDQKDIVFSSPQECVGDSEESASAETEKIVLDQKILELLTGQVTAKKTASKDGNFSINSGVMLTPEMIEAANQQGVLGDLVMNVK